MGLGIGALWEYQVDLLRQQSLQVRHGTKAKSDTYKRILISEFRVLVSGSATDSTVRKAMDWGPQIRNPKNQKESPNLDL